MKTKTRWSLLAALLILAGSIWCYLDGDDFFQPFDKKLADTLFRVRGPVAADPRIVIVDIDERSLRKLGQWPWPRNRMAKILENLTRAGVAVVGMDVVFSEPDRSSPRRILEAYGIDAPDAPDYDLRLARAVANSPTILGYFFDFENRDAPSGEPPTVPAIVVERGEVSRTFLPSATRVVPNVPVIQEAAYSSGFFNTLPDADGIVRSVPLFVRFDDTPFPAISLEMYRALLGARRVAIDYAVSGVSGIALAGTSLVTDRFGRLTLNYRGPGKTYPYLSAVDVLQGDLPPGSLQGKIVFVGTSATGLLDLRATPYDNVFRGVEIHATAIDNMIHGDYLVVPDWIETADIAVLALMTLALLLLFLYASPLLVAALSLALLAAFYLFAYYLFAAHHLLIGMAFPTLLFFALVFVLGAIGHFTEARIKERIREKFARKVSPAVVEELLKRPDSDTFETQRKEVTIFFSDIRSFTTISEKIENPERLVTLLNRYLTPMAEIVMEEEGTIDKFIGDAIMAYWNAPRRHPAHRDAAVTAALRQTERLEKLNKELAREGYPAIRIGIAIHTGEVIVGEMGSSGRSDFTIVGDNVNLASRLEALNKYYGSTIIVSEETRKGLAKEYAIRPLDRVRVRGREKPVEIFEVFGWRVKRKEREELARYEEALALYRNGRFEEALTKFGALCAERPLHLYEIYRNRCEKYLAEPPNDFDGVFAFGA